MAVPFAMPPGYRFLPTHQELITHYLEKKSRGFEVSHIHDVPFYHHTPQELAKKYMGCDDDACYFFTKRSMKGKRSCRVACGGTWSGRTAGRAIHGSNKEDIIGHWRYFVYEDAGEKKVKRKPVWAMLEYTLSPPKSTEWVLCKLYKTHRATATGEEEEEDGDVIDDQPAENNWESLAPLRPLDQPVIDTRSKKKERPEDDRVAAATSINVEDGNKSKRQRTRADENEEILFDDIGNVDISELPNLMNETETIPMYHEDLDIGDYLCMNYTLKN